MAGQRATPTQVAHELGIRPQVIYGLIKRNRVHAYGTHPVQVDVGEVKTVLKEIKTRVPKSKSNSKKAEMPIGQLVSYSGDYKGAGAKKRKVVVTTGTLRSDEPDGVDFLVFSDGTRRTVDMFSTMDMGEMLQKGFAQLQNIDGVLGMIIFQMTHQGDIDKASALEEFCINVLDIVPLKYTKDAQATE